MMSKNIAKQVNLNVTNYFAGDWRYATIQPDALKTYLKNENNKRFETSQRERKKINYKE